TRIPDCLWPPRLPPARQSAWLCVLLARQPLWAVPGCRFPPSHSKSPLPVFLPTALRGFVTAAPVVAPLRPGRVASDTHRDTRPATAAPFALTAVQAPPAVRSRPCILRKTVGRARCIAGRLAANSHILLGSIRNLPRWSQWRPRQCSRT